MKMEMTRGMQKSIAKHGSVLKAFRAQGGGGAGLMAGGIVLLVFGVPLGLLCLLSLGSSGLLVGAVFMAPGLLLILWGGALRKKRLANYLEFYRKDTGYSEEELRQADRELMSPDAVKIGGKMDNSGGKNGIIFMKSWKKYWKNCPKTGLPPLCCSTAAAPPAAVMSWNTCGSIF